MKKLLTTTIVSMTIFLGCVKTNAPHSTFGPAHISSLSSMSGLPTSLLTITGTGFGATNTMSIRFSDTNGYLVDIQALESNATSASVCVPPYVFSGSGEFGTGVVSVAIIENGSSASNTSAIKSNSVEGFHIQDLPTITASPGAITLSFLKGELAYYDSLQSNIKNTSMDTLNGVLSVNRATLQVLASQIQGVVQDSLTTFSLGAINGVTLTVGSKQLQQSDRLISCFFATLNSSDFSTIISSLSKRAGSRSNDGCPDVAFNLDNGTDNYQEVQNCIFLQKMSGVGRGFKVFLGIAAVSIGIFALAGATSALASAGVLYIGVMAAGTQLSLGALLKDVNSAAAYQALHNGIEQTEALFMDPIKSAAVSKLFGETVGTLKDIYDGANQIRDNTPASVIKCSYSLSAAGQSFDSSGGSGSVALIAGNGCPPWTAEVDNVDWITVTSNSTASGTGMVDFSVLPNPTTDTRTGSIFIAGKSFDIVETGKNKHTDPLPNGFPSNVPTGLYAVSVDITGVNGSTNHYQDYLDTNNDISVFAQGLMGTMNSFLSQVDGIHDDGCSSTSSISYTPWNGASFKIIGTIVTVCPPCVSAGICYVGGTAYLTYTITKN